MDSVGIQIAPVMGESLYEFSSHGNTGYSYATPLWQGKEERGYQSVAQDTATRRNDGQTREVTRRSTVSDVEIKTPVEEWNEPEDKKDFTSEGTTENGSQKQSQVASTLKWLTENYERAEGVCLPRCVLYTHYLDFCKKRKFTPAGAATFGKIIRQKFPKLTTRRLGTRGQSKYHYYGIGIKETSIYYHSVYSGKGLTRFSGIKIKTEGSNRKYSLSSKTGTLLPEFPDADNLILSDDIDRDKMQTFIMMYRTHCQRILDTVVSANFEEVQNFLLHFWQGMPEHLVELLKADMIADIVGLCDSILYKVLIDVLIPSTIQDLPESLGSEIKLFIKRLPYWLESSLENVPDKIIKKKMNVVKGFMQSIRRQISFVHLAQTARTVLLNHETINQMIEDVADINFTEICCQAGFMNLSTASKFQDTINEFFDEFINLLSKQAPIEAYTEWMDNIIDKCVLEKNKDNGHSFKDKASEFLLQWAIFGSLFMRDLTLHSASTFGSFHLIHMMFDEYVFLVMETQHDITNEKLLQKNIQKYMKNAEEIKMSAKIRPPNNKNNISPKHKKRKHSEDNYDSTDEPDVTRLCDENRPNISDSYTPLNGTAFSRPAPSNNRDQNSFVISDDPCRSGFHHSTLPLSPLKNFSSFNTGHYDRSSYLPQYGINSYNDYMNSSGSLGAASRVQGYADSHVQSFSSVPLNGGMHQSGSYWSDSRTHPSLHDPYNPYTYNKLHSSYESFNKSSFLRSGTYQDPFNRSAFDTSRSYYRGPHDNFQVGTHFPGLNGNYMDIAQPPSQYGRQETVIYQDDLYPGSMTTSFSSIGKPYLTCAPPFR